MRLASVLSSLLLGILLLGTRPLAAQTIPPQGEAATFEAATWNIEWLGDTDNGPTNEQLQQDRAIAVLGQSDIDLWCLQEVSSTSAFNNILATLGDGYAGVLSTDSGRQRLAYVYKTDVVQNLGTENVLTQFDFEFAGRPPLQMRARVLTQEDGGTIQTDVRVLCFHAKAFSDVASYNRRVAASEALKNYSDNLAAINTRVLLLGDYNDELGGSTSGSRPSPYANFVEDDGYVFASADLDASNTPTFCGNSSCTSGSTLDHIAFTDNLAGPYVEGSGNRYDELLGALPGYTFTVSDHLPVFARFDFGTSVSADDDATPSRFALDAPFPNPFTAAASVRFALPSAVPVDLAVFDALGRRVATLASGPRPAGPHTVTLDGGALPPGLYLVRLTAGDQSATRRLVRVP
ncbi:MAG: endonuclease/exonuclease/phosphatase family protein [Bacteroidota bacterium]